MKTITFDKQGRERKPFKVPVWVIVALIVCAIRYTGEPVERLRKDSVDVKRTVRNITRGTTRNWLYLTKGENAANLYEIGYEFRAIRNRLFNF